VTGKGDARLRAGVHPGEAYAVEGQLFGTCVTVAARVAAEASASEILTTPVVSGLVEGSGFHFENAHSSVVETTVGARRIEPARSDTSWNMTLPRFRTRVWC
jgi:class 3 adenylate cyclase